MGGSVGVRMDAARAHSGVIRGRFAGACVRHQSMSDHRAFRGGVRWIRMPPAMRREDDAEVEALDDEDILDAAEDVPGVDYDDDTQIQSRGESSEDTTSPTLSLASQS